MLNGEALLRIALEAGAAHAALIDVRRIEYHEDFRKACEKNVCGRYDTSWMGPPAIGPIAELREKAAQYGQAMIFQTEHGVAGNFDMKGMLEAARAHERIFRTLLAAIRRTFPGEAILPLSAGCCNLCPECAYLTREPCRHPEQAVSSVEAYGIHVLDLQKKAGLPFYKGKESVMFVGLILFDRKVQKTDG